MNLQKRQSLFERKSTGSFSQIYRPEFAEDEENVKKHEKMWNLSNEYIPSDVPAI